MGKNFLINMETTLACIWFRICTISSQLWCTRVSFIRTITTKFFWTKWTKHYDSACQCGLQELDIDSCFLESVELFPAENTARFTFILPAFRREGWNKKFGVGDIADGAIFLEMKECPICFESRNL